VAAVTAWKNLSWPRWFVCGKILELLVLLEGV